MKKLHTVWLERHGHFHATTDRVDAAMKIAKRSLAKQIAGAYESPREFSRSRYWLQYDKTTLAVVHADLFTETV
jgi:hypothetical protein